MEIMEISAAKMQEIFGDEDSDRKVFTGNPFIGTYSKNPRIRT